MRKIVNNWDALPHIQESKMVNINTETGIRFGVIPANSLDPEVVDELQARGTDVHYEAARQDMEDAIRKACKPYMLNELVQQVVDLAVEYMEFDDEEPVHEFKTLDGVVGSTGWLGGALHVWVYYSPNVGKFRQCSPCVPNAADLDSPDPDGIAGYDVPADWRAK